MLYPGVKWFPPELQHPRHYDKTQSSWVALHTLESGDLLLQHKVSVTPAAPSGGLLI